MFIEDFAFMTKRIARLTEQRAALSARLRALDTAAAVATSGGSSPSSAPAPLEEGPGAQDGGAGAAPFEFEDWTMEEVVEELKANTARERAILASHFAVSGLLGAWGRRRLADFACG
jgi:hypothetical protein